MLRGSCLCGGIVYEIDALLGPGIYCHCSQCRKASGTAFATNASVPTTAFRMVVLLVGGCAGSVARGIARGRVSPQRVGPSMVPGPSGVPAPCPPRTRWQPPGP